jgi:hypothetical protein
MVVVMFYALSLLLSPLLDGNEPCRNNPLMRFNANPTQPMISTSLGFSMPAYEENAIEKGTQ